MSGIVSLDELLNTEDLKDYGLKAEGLVTLKRFISSLDLSELDIRYPVVVPDLFAVPVSAELDDPQLSEKYFALTSEFKEPRIILARSSDPDEQPGLFETHLSFFNPASPESSFHYWLEAAKKVRASGSRALLGQAMVGALEDFPHDINYDELSDYRKMYVTLPSFGGTNSSFVGRSHSVIRGNRPSLVACRGLGTKIARGDRDVVIITSGKNRTDALNLIHNYRSESLAISPQETVDVVSLTHPDRISTLDYHSDAQFDEMAFHARIPFAKYLFEDRENGY